MAPVTMNIEIPGSAVLAGGESALKGLYRIKHGFVKNRICQAECFLIRSSVNNVCNLVIACVGSVSSMESSLSDC